MASIYIKRFPILKTVLPGTAAIACGDILCQHLEGKEEWCPERTARMTLTGALIVTPLAHYLGRGVDKVVPKVVNSSSNTPAALVTKAGLNAACSVFFIVGSFTGNNILQGRGLKVLRAQLGERLLPTYASGLAYWSGANLLLFGVFGPQGVAATMVAQTLWNVKMSSALNMKTPEVEAELAKEERHRHHQQHRKRLTAVGAGAGTLSRGRE